MRLQPILILVLATLFVNTTLAAPPSAMSKLPDEVVQSLRENASTSESPVREVLRRKLDTLREEIEAGEQGAEQPAKAVRAAPMHARRAASHRAEMQQLRDQVQRELDDLQGKVRDVAGEGKASEVTRLAAQVRSRFDRLDSALQRLDESRDEGEARGARASLASLLKNMRSTAETIPAAPVPTLSPLRPQLREPGQGAPSQKLPQYALELMREQRYAENSGGLTQAVYRGNGFGFFKASSTLQPVAPDAATDCSSSAADLVDDGAEVRITPEIQALAQELQYSPARILRWMLKEVKFEPYWGSLKGSLGVLQTRAGNATDQSSLLIALLRASNVPARYVRGTVALYDMQPSDNTGGRAQRWLGAKNYSGSIAYLGSSVPASAYIINGAVQGISFDHVWAQACVPFAAYRGNLADSGGYRWVPLDPSVKDADYQAGIAVNVPLDAGFYATYLANRKDKLPPDYLADLVETAARAVKSDASVEDVPYRGTPRTLRLDVLPSATPYAVIQFSNWPGSSLPETSAIPDAHRHKFAVTVKNGSGATLATSTVTFPQSVFKRVTVSYAPDAASQTLWNSWGGALAALPAGSVNVYPQIKLDGALAASGSAAPAMVLNTTHSITMKLTQGEDTSGQCIADSGVSTDPRDPDTTCLNKTVYTNVKAGAYYALGVNANHASDAMLEDRAELLATGVRDNPSAPTPASGTAYDATVGELLHLVLQNYIHSTDQADKRIAELRGFRSAGSYDIGLTGSDIKTDYIFDLPLTVKPAGVYVDFKGGLYSFAKMDSAAPTQPNAGETTAAFSARRSAALSAEQVELAKLSIYSGSALEHRVWQEALRTDAVSTVRGLQYAGETGNTLVTFTPANIGQYATLMQMSGATSMAAYQPSIQAEVAAGATVTVPRAQIAYTDPVDAAKAWRGAVYMSENATSGAYGALINGSLSGGFPLLNSTQLPSLFSSNNAAPTFQNQLGGGQGLLTALAPGVQGSNPIASMAFDPVNLLTGNLTHSESDLNLKGRGGLPVVLDRWYNSGNPADGPLGYGWTHSFNHQIKLYGVENGVAKVSWVNGSGGETHFSTASQTGGDIARGATLTNSPGVNVQFTRISGGADDGKYRIRERDGLVYLFASATGPNVTPSAGSAVLARLLSITDRNGNALTLNYTGSQLTTVTDSLGRTALSFTWSGGHLTQIADYSGRTVKYAYTDGNNNLTQVTDALNQTHGYSYYTAADGSKLDHHLKRHTLPRGNGMEFEYYSGGQVFRHTPADTGGSLIDSGAVSFHYNLFDRTAWTVNERGYERHTSFDSYGNPVAIVDENGGGHTYSYDPANPYNRLGETDSVGRHTGYTYNAQNLLETTTLPSGAVLEYRDYTAFAQPQRVKDARGNWTWLKYDASGNPTDRIAVKSGITPVAGTQPAASDIVAWSKTAFDSAGNPTVSTRVKNFAAGSGPSLTRNWDSNKLNLTSLTRSGNRNGATVNETTPAFTYDSLNRLKTGADSRWYPIALDYDALDRVTSATDALGKTHRPTYDANGNLTQTELVDNGARLDSAATQLDAQDRPVALLDYAGNRSTLSYDAAGNLIARTGPDNFTTGFDYDPDNRVTAAFDQEGNRAYTQLDTQGRPITLTDPNGNTSNYSYWGSTTYDGRLKRITRPAIPGQSAGRATELDYDANGNIIRTRSIAADGTGTRQSYTFYDELGRVTRSVGAPDDTGNRLQTCYGYDTLSNLTQLKAGATLDVTSPTCPGSPAVQLTQSWDDFGELLSKTDALSHVWSYTYDSHGNLATSQSPEQAKVSSSNKTVYSYDPSLNGLLQSRAVPGSGAAGQTVSYTRNALGQITRAETRDGSNTLIAAYDYGYDVAHRLASIADSRGNKSLNYAWTPGGRLAKLTLADTGSITHQWDYKYDAVGRPSALIAPNGQTASFALDPAGRLIERSFGNTLTSRYVWLADGSLQSVEHLAGGSQLARHAYTYDTWGNRNTAADTLNGSTVAKTYGYDALDRLKSVANGAAAQDENYAFDLLGNRTTKSIGTPVSQSWTSTFDAANQLAQIQQTTGGSAVTALLVYDDNGNLKKLCEAGAGSVTGTTTDCTASGTGSQTTATTWNGLDQLVTLAKSGTAALNEAYAYDDAGRRLAKTSGGLTTAYLYDGDAILGEWNNAVAGSPAAVYAHGGTDDPLMRLTGNSGGTDASTLAYLADGLGSVQTAAGNMVTGGPVAATGVTPTNSYNEGAYPSAKTIDGDTTGSTGFWAGTANTTTPSTLTLELGSSRTLSRVKLHRVAAYLADYTVKAADVQLRQADNSWLTVGTLAGNTTADSPEIAFTPAAGSAVRVIFKGARAGALVLVAEVTLQLDSGPSSLSTQRFDAWGNLLQATGSIPAYGYTGREPDQSGLTYYRARYYHPGLGRFTSRDPIGLNGGINQYAYVNGNPVNFNDPSGLLAKNAANTISTYYGAAANYAGNALASAGQGIAQNLQSFGQGVSGQTSTSPSVANFAGLLVNQGLQNAANSPLNIPVADSNGNTILTIGVGPGVISEVGAGLGAVARGVVPAAERATQIANTLGNSQRFITVGVTDTLQGVRIISSSENALRPAALNALADGEIAVTGIGHAEVTGINAARGLGLTPSGTAASRLICPACAQFLQNQGVLPLSPLK